MNATERVVPIIGDEILADGWGNSFAPAKELHAGDSSGNWSCQFRVPMGGYPPMYMIGVNVVITGKRPRMDANHYGAYRCRIEFVGDGTPSEFAGGWWRPNMAARR